MQLFISDHDKLRNITSEDVFMFMCCLNEKSTIKKEDRVFILSSEINKSEYPSMINATVDFQVMNPKGDSKKYRFTCFRAVNWACSNSSISELK